MEIGCGENGVSGLHAVEMIPHGDTVTVTICDVGWIVLGPQFNFRTTFTCVILSIQYCKISDFNIPLSLRLACIVIVMRLLRE